MVCVSCEEADLRGIFASYESVDLRFMQSIAWNDRNPPAEIIVPFDAYSIYVMSDSHVGDTDNLSIFLDKAASASAAAVVMAGDLTTGQTADFVTLDEMLSDAEDLPVFPMVGNHDLYFGGWEQYYPIFGSSTYYFTVSTPIAEDLFICLDTGSGTLGPKQLQWLKHILETSRQDYRHCLVFTHVNFFRTRKTFSTNPLTEELHVLTDLFARYSVDMVIAGHDHQRSEVDFGNTTYLVTDALSDENIHASYLALDFGNGGITYRFTSVK